MGLELPGAIPYGLVVPHPQRPMRAVPAHREQAGVQMRAGQQPRRIQRPIAQHQVLGEPGCQPSLERISPLALMSNRHPGLQRPLPIGIDHPPALQAHVGVDPDVYVSPREVVAQEGAGDEGALIGLETAVRHAEMGCGFCKDHAVASEPGTVRIGLPHVQAADLHLPALGERFERADQALQRWHHLAVARSDDDGLETGLMTAFKETGLHRGFPDRNLLLRPRDQPSLPTRDQFRDYTHLSPIHPPPYPAARYG
jgi:hypothetical protein